MGKKKPLTKYQQFIADHLNWGADINVGYDNKLGKWITRKRTPTEWRRLINGRLKSPKWRISDDHSRLIACEGGKHQDAVEALDAMREAINGDSYEKFQSAIWKLRNAMKYQGYLQLEIAFIEMLMEKSGDKELAEAVRKKRLEMKLKRKVDKINGGV